MSNLKAGSAMRKITPSLDALLKMGGDGPFRHTGIAEDIFVRVVVLSDGKQKLAVIAADLVRFPAQQVLCDRLSKEFNIEPLGCIFACTHNHGALNGTHPEDDFDMMLSMNMMPMHKSQELYDFTLFIHDMVCEAVSEAVTKLEPARLGYNKGLSFINACRDLPTPVGGVQTNNFHAKGDHELIVIKVESLKGETIGIMVNNCTHSNYLMCKDLHSDLGGAISRFVERNYKNEFPVLYAIGCAGEMNPITRNTLRLVEVDDGGNYSYKNHTLDIETSRLQLKSLASIQGMEIVKLANETTDFTDKYSFSGAETYRDIPSRISYAKLKINPLCGERPDPVPMDKPVTLRFRLAQICGVAFAGVNCEAYSLLGLMVKAMLPVKKSFFVEMAYGHAGYIPDAETESINGYGTMQSFARSGADSEAAFKDAFSELIKKVF